MGKAFHCLTSQLSLPLTPHDLSVMGSVKNCAFSPPGASIRNTASLVSLPFLFMFKHIPQHRWKIRTLSLLPFSPQVMLTISIFMDFSSVLSKIYVCEFFVLIEKHTEFTIPDKVETL